MLLLFINVIIDIFLTELNGRYYRKIIINQDRIIHLLHGNYCFSFIFHFSFTLCPNYNLFLTISISPVYILCEQFFNETVPTNLFH